MPGAHVLPDPKRYTVEPMTGLEVYKIGREAIITLQPSTGYVAVSCAWHPELNGCHWWNSRGPESLHRFLVSLDRHYTMKKLFDRHALEEYDEDRTKAELRKLILSGRRDGSWTRDEARDLWDQVEAAESADDIARMTGLDCPYECIRYKQKDCADWFWDHVWSAFIAHIRTVCLANSVLDGATPSNQVIGGGNQGGAT
jgi:hypothetical protein